MMNSTYLGISAQLTLQRRLDTIANNVANSSSTGFRAEQVRFTVAPSSATAPGALYSATGETYLSRASGEVVRTDNPLDLAIAGDAWLAISTPDGIAYTRDGRLQITPAGELRTLTGHELLDAGGSAILLDPTAGPPEIASDGTITQAGRRVATIGLYAIDAGARLSRGPESSVRPDREAQPLVDTAISGLRQGFVERSNVNPLTEMSRLIMDQRMFEAVTNALGETERTMNDAIRNLGATT